MLLLSRECGLTIDGAPVINGIPIALQRAEMPFKPRTQGGLSVSRAGSYAHPLAQAIEEFLEMPRSARMVD